MKYIFCLLFFISNILFIPNVFAAFPVIDFSTLFQLEKEFERLGDQLNLLKQQIAQLKSYNWNTAQNKINELGQIVNQSQGLAYNAANIDAQFKTTFPGYKPVSNYSDQYKNIVTTTQTTLNNILQSLGKNASNFEDENQRLKILQQQAQNADGQTKAIQAAAQIASAQVEQLQLLRHTVIAQTNAQTAYYAAEIQKDATSKVAFDEMVNGSKKDVTGKLDQSPIRDPFDR